MQGKLHSHTPHSFQQFVRICSKDPTLMPTYYEPNKNQMPSKTREKVKSPSPPFIACFCLTFKTQHQIGHMFHSHQKKNLIEIP
jgi:hypothetical protein